MENVKIFANWRKMKNLRTRQLNELEIGTKYLKTSYSSHSDLNIHKHHFTIDIKDCLTKFKNIILNSALLHNRLDKINSKNTIQYLGRTRK